MAIQSTSAPPIRPERRNPSLVGVILLHRWTRVLISMATVLVLTDGALAQSGNSTVTTSTSSSESVHDTLQTQRVDTYTTRLLAILDGTTTVFDQTFTLQFSDPQVQSALGAAHAALIAGALPNAVTVSGPSESNTQTALQESKVSTHIDQSVVSEKITLEDTIGPATILIGNRDLGGEAFDVLAGTTNININTHTLTDLFRTIITTDTFLTSSTWTLFGVSETTGGGTVPEPSSLALILAAFGGMGWAARRRVRR